MSTESVSVVSAPTAVLAAVARRYHEVTTRRFGARGSSALRIGFGGIWILYLLHEYSERDVAWGPDSPWSPALDHDYAATSHWTGWIAAWFTSVADLTRTEFDWFYLATLAVAAAFALGWHTRFTAVLFMGTVLALENRSPLLTDGGDNVLILMSIYLVFAASADHWSLDARRRNRRAGRIERAGPADASGFAPAQAIAPWRVELGAARRQSVTLVHNGAVLLIAAQVCVIYATAGLTKVQGQMWQNGSAMGYVLRLVWFQPWPGLSHWLAGHTMMLTLVGYVTVLVQAGFAFIVFSPRLKYPALAVLVLMHVSIAVVLGLPFFSAIMLIGDGIFLSDRVWQAVERRVAGPAYARDMTGDDSGTVFTGRRATLVFDGDCAFCTTSVTWGRRHLGAPVDFVPWQELDLAAVGLTRERAEHAVQWLPAPDRPGTIRSGAGAVGRLLLLSRWPWRAFAAPALIPPFSWVAAVLYRLVAANRHRLPGGTPACAVPAATRAAMAAAATAAASAAAETHDSPDTGFLATAFVPPPTSAEVTASGSPQGGGDVDGGPDHAGAGASRVELAEGDHAD
ncbi:MAG TPA: DCC1-like thiol-disulfide oxidoreductase family protein [Actinocrinis sp.]|nr:DCC1-like thiol-disulfide oxidoreductase family protein [Actinocrinis sp.]